MDQPAGETRILDGKKLSNLLLDEIRDAVQKRAHKGLKTPHLAAILVGENGASLSYVQSKIRMCEKTGIRSTLMHLDENTSETELLQHIQTMNSDADIDGFIVQLPLPAHLDPDKMIPAIDPDKDVDGFHPINLGRMQLGLPTFLSATPAGVMLLLERYAIETAGKHCVILGRSNIVGTPLAILLSRNTEPGNCTVTLCHSKTKNIKEICRTADILIAALGRPHFVTADMVKAGAVIIDVGITRVPANNAKGYVVQGDVDFEQAAPIASAITPVPGGVGPMTVVSLLLNTLQATEKKDNQ